MSRSSSLHVALGLEQPGTAGGAGLDEVPDPIPWFQPALLWEGGRTQDRQQTLGIPTGNVPLQEGAAGGSEGSSELQIAVLSLRNVKNK